MLPCMPMHQKDLLPMDLPYRLMKKPSTLQMQIITHWLFLIYPFLAARARKVSSRLDGIPPTLKLLARRSLLPMERVSLLLQILTDQIQRSQCKEREDMKVR